MHSFFVVYFSQRFQHHPQPRLWVSQGLPSSHIANSGKKVKYQVNTLKRIFFKSKVVHTLDCIIGYLYKENLSFIQHNIFTMPSSRSSNLTFLFPPYFLLSKIIKKSEHIFTPVNGLLRKKSFWDWCLSFTFIS